MATEKVVYELSLRDLMTKGLNDINGKLDRFEKNADKAAKKTKGLSSEFNSLKGAIASIGFIALGTQMIQTTAKFQSLHNAIKFSSDGAIQGGASVRWLSDMSKEMGLNLEGTTEGFKTFQGAMMNTKFSSGEVRNMFKQVSTGVTAMGLSTEDAKGTFLALGQIMGKGKVQAEELRGQIGERVPGAFSLAARAMGVTTAQLDKLMKDGKLMSEDFLPKFAAEMEKTFGAGAVLQANSLTSSINRMSNGWTELMVAMGNSADGSGIFNWIGEALDKFADRFRTIEDIAKNMSNAGLVKRLDLMDKISKNKRADLMKQGVTGNALSDALQVESMKWQQRTQNDLANASKELNDLSSRILTAEGVRGQLSPEGADKKIGDLMLQKKQSVFYDSTNVDQGVYDKWLEKRAEVQRLKDSILGTKQVFDKTADMSAGGSGSSEAEKLAKQSASVSGGVPKVVNINIEALIKGVTNQFTTGQTASDAAIFLDQLQMALNTIVTDVGIVSQYSK
jgi:tape measure domain-containing protein